jgi:hypothetical protein
LFFALFLFATPVLMLGMWVWAAMVSRALAHHSHGLAARPYHGFGWSDARSCYLTSAAADVDVDRASLPHTGGHPRVAEANSDELVELALLCLSDLRREGGAPAGGKRGPRARLGRVACNPYLH